MKNKENQKNIKEKKEKKDNKDNKDTINKDPSPINIKDSPKINIYPHLRQNILQPAKNCKDISEKVYYCLNCKCSTCEKCSLKEHIDHKLVLKKDFLDYDSIIFEETSQKMKEAFNFDNNLDALINNMEQQALAMHAKIDEVKEKKIDEIKTTFNSASKNIDELIQSVNNIEQTVKDFYEKNKRFFNEKKNKDYDNTIFLMKYEFMTLCNNKNKEIIKGVSEFQKEFKNYEESINTQTEKVIQEINNFLGYNKPRDKFDDYYWDVKFRIKTYNEHINKVQKGIYDILAQTGDINDLQEIVNILDSKNKKGIQYIFNQDYFNKPQNNNEEQGGRVGQPYNNKEKKTLNLSMKENENPFKNIVKNNKLNFIRLNNYDYNSPKARNKRSSPFSKSNSISQCDSITRSKNGNRKFGSLSIPYKRTVFNDDIKHTFKKLGIKSYNDIILDDKIKEKYFTYSVIDLYNRLFNNQARKSFDNNARIFADYNERNSILKEYIKPIPCSNEIIVYNPTIDRSKKIKLPLNKKTHGYDKFPAGCRHLNIENKVYICGGVDEINIPLSICLVYNSTTNTIQRIDDMNVTHAYHSMEFLDNYDCFLVVGGENNKAVELFDIFTNKWTRLPDLNVPRANINIYFNDFTSEIYALFGMLGNVSKKHIDNSEIIEVLELNDISSGWCKVDYYKGSFFDLRNEIVTTLPFTRNKLLIYGGKSVREVGKLFGLFLIDRLEVIKADKEVIEKIKCEQKKIKLLNKTHSKAMGFTDK